MKMSPLSIQYLPTSGPKAQGTVQMKKAMVRTTGVYLRAKASTSFSVSEVFAWASSTSWIKRESVESS
eukprot:CAMPEP_0183778656 /NCGR_PEP_ID=MMETSP0739-20130205/51968_1 /TAXON_ID=385413 /ORGANISM="Thalassiosira miniscula, Strain CCMP1093" /LENGTH=67 /DNA_ID=CAMNT_0026021089 /DNA_START=14 /DNA_END=214 /DNA_ORIENTATION=-